MPLLRDRIDHSDTIPTTYNTESIPFACKNYRGVKELAEVRRVEYAC